MLSATNSLATNALTITLILLCSHTTDLFSDYNGATFSSIFIEEISPRLIFVRPPETLAIEVSVKGRYARILWHRNGTSVSMSSLSNFNELYVVQATSTLDFGHYQVIPNTIATTLQLVRPAELSFIVTSPGVCITTITKLYAN